jgi:bifunctional DNA-binding transcriptional regulator/antitoxin component of YhaV-PrlF toxin-antitoxin module
MDKAVEEGKGVLLPFESWERLPGESSAAYAAFCAFRDFGPERELSEEARRYGLERGAFLYYDEDSQAVVLRELMDKPNCDFTKNGGDALRDEFARYIDKSLREHTPEYWGYRLWRFAGVRSRA